LVVLLEGIHQSAVEALRHGGYSRIVTHAKSLADIELCAALAEASFLGIRSRTQLTEEVLRHAHQPNWCWSRSSC
jgi:D-3-phosphoglycerate dehydrogenase